VGTDVAERSGAGVEVGEEKWRETERERGACGGRKVCGSDGVGVMDVVADVIFWVPAEVYIRFENSYLQIKKKILKKKLKEVEKTLHVYTQVTEESNDVFSTLVFCTKTLPKF